MVFKAKIEGINRFDTNAPARSDVDISASCTSALVDKKKLDPYAQKPSMPALSQHAYPNEWTGGSPCTAIYCFFPARSG